MSRTLYIRLVLKILYCARTGSILGTARTGQRLVKILRELKLALLG
jgi:hypothetical protein